jgi:hypothetical protein
VHFGSGRLKFLATGKARLNSPEKTVGDTPLHVAARYNAPQCAIKLLKAGMIFRLNSMAQLYTLRYQQHMHLCRSCYVDAQ